MPNAARQSDPFQRHGDTLPDADAHGGEGKTLAGQRKFERRRAGNEGSRSYPHAARTRLIPGWPGTRSGGAAAPVTSITAAGSANAVKMG